MHNLCWLMRVRNKVWLAIAIFVVAGCASSRSVAPLVDGSNGKSYAFVGGLWFNGNGFSPGKFYSDHGKLTRVAPQRVDSVIDISGRFVIPPLGDAHTHNIEDNPSLDQTIQRYLRAGIFYIENPDILPRSREAIAGRVNTPGSVDVIFANGGLTSTGGHPAGVADRMVAQGSWTTADTDGGFYWAINNSKELDQAWDKILDGKPDFIKVFLLYSEEFVRRRDDEHFRTWRGLNPALVEEVVRRAHSERLRVAVHVESATDFRVAVRARADQIAHLPGFRRDGPSPRIGGDSAYRLTKADADLAARQGTVVVTTIFGEAGSSVVKQNLRLLQERGVKLAVGTDSYENITTTEINALRATGVFKPVELLRMLVETTPRTIFPDRQVGRLAEGFEASFLVLRRNPLKSLNALSDIRLRLKDGRLLEEDQAAKQ